MTSGHDKTFMSGSSSERETPLGIVSNADSTKWLVRGGFCIILLSWWCIPCVITHIRSVANKAVLDLGLLLGHLINFWLIRYSHGLMIVSLASICRELSPTGTSSKQLGWDDNVYIVLIKSAHQFFLAILPSAFLEWLIAGDLIALSFFTG